MAAPLLSVIVAGSRPEGPVPELLRVLAPAATAGKLEVLFATSRESSAALPSWARVVRCAVGTNVPGLRLAGVRAASGELLALTEDFCVPDPSWAEALLEEHQRLPRAVLGGPVARRDGSASDWALTLIEYGRFFDPRQQGVVTDLPSINVAYPREVLLSALPPNDDGIFEVALHARLRESGAIFQRVPRAVMFDCNSAAIGNAARAQYHHGRLFGGGRAEGQGWISRLRYAALSPVVPAVLFSRIARQVTSAGHTAELVRSAPSLSLLLGAWALGEGLGSLLGPGDSAARWT